MRYKVYFLIKVQAEMYFEYKHEIDEYFENDRNSEVVFRDEHHQGELDNLQVEILDIHKLETRWGRFRLKLDIEFRNPPFERIEIDDNGYDLKAYNYEKETHEAGVISWQIDENIADMQPCDGLMKELKERLKMIIRYENRPL